MKKRELEDGGTYRARCVQAVLTRTKGSAKSEQVAAQFALTDEPTVTLAWFGLFGNKAGRDGVTMTERTVRSMRVCGWVGDDLTDLKSMTTNEVDLVVGYEEYQGRRRLRVRFIQEPGAFRHSEMDGAAAFAKKMKASIARIK